MKEEESEETLAQQRDRLALALAHGSVRVDSHIKVEDSTSGEDTDGAGEGEGEGEGGEGGTGGEGDDGDGEERLGGEGGLVLLAGAAHIPDHDGSAPRRSTPADRATRAKRGRGDVAATNDVPDASVPKRYRGGAQVGPSGRHGVDELTGKTVVKATPWLKWRARLSLPGDKHLQLGYFATVDDAARTYDAEVQRRGWVHARPLNFPLSEEVAAYAQAGKRCDERGQPISLESEPHVGAHGAAPRKAPRVSARQSSVVESLARVGSLA